MLGLPLSLSLLAQVCTSTVLIQRRRDTYNHRTNLLDARESVSAVRPPPLILLRHRFRTNVLDVTAAAE